MQRPSYSYRHLSADVDQIRLVRILPGEFDKDVVVKLEATAFSGQSDDAPSYEALSYAWGDAQDRVDIFIKADEQAWRLAVTRNCSEALRHLRLQDAERTMWIDAISINQADLEERGRQVSIMKTIFGNATQVVVWLGPASSNSDLAMQWIDTVGREITLHQETLRFLPLSSSTERIDHDGILATEAEVEAFADLIDRPYFDRLWVWQEVRMGGDHVVLMCGRSHSLFSRLITTVNYYRYKCAGVTSTSWRPWHRASFIAQMPLHAQSQALSVLDRFRACKCTDERDRIYTCQAFGDLFQEDLVLVPDYSKDVQAVYTEFILKTLSVVKSCGFLRDVGDTPSSQPGIDGLPSWVPDWSKRNNNHLSDVAICSGSSAASVVSADSETLVLRGLAVGRVERVVPSGFDLVSGFTSDEVREALRGALREICPKDRDPNSDFQYVRVCTGDGFAEHYFPAVQDLPEFDQCQRCFRYLLDTDESKPITTQDDKLLKCFAPLAGHSLFNTRDGRVGIAPHNVLEGDVLAVILGCSALVVLRPLAGALNTFRVVGTALCTGLIDGEAVLGPLPVDYETVCVFDRPSGHYNKAFRRKSTQELLYEDPRLPPLLPGWHMGFVPWSEVHCYANNTTGEVRPYSQDPRLDASELESRGVELEEFRLV